MKSKVKNLMMVLTSLMIILLFCVSTAYADNPRIFVSVSVFSSISEADAYEAAMSFIDAINLKGLSSLELPDSGFINPQKLKEFLPPLLKGSFTHTEVVSEPKTKRDRWDCYASVEYEREQEYEGNWEEIDIGIKDIGQRAANLQGGCPPCPWDEKYCEFTKIKGFDAWIYKAPYYGSAYEVGIKVIIGKGEEIIIKSLKGPVAVMRNMKPVTVKDGDPIEQYDVIKAQKKGRIYLLIDGVNKFCVYENSMIRVVTKIKTKTKFEVVWGKVRVIIGKLKGDFNIDTPTTAIGVRGTDFLLEVEKDGTSTVTVIEGVLEVSDLVKERTVFVKGGERLTVKPGELLSEPVIADSTEIDSLRNIPIE